MALDIVAVDVVRESVVNLELIKSLVSRSNISEVLNLRYDFSGT